MSDLGLSENPPRRPGFPWLILSFWLWVVVVTFLSVERLLWHQQVHAIVVMRQFVNTLCGSGDAFPNLEHVMFGLATGWMGVMVVSMPGQDPADTVSVRWAWQERGTATFTAMRGRLATALVAKMRQHIPLRLRRILTWNERALPRILLVALAGLALTSIVWHFRYGVQDLLVAAVVVLLIAAAAWRPRVAAVFVRSQPTFAAALICLPVWLHFEGAWKINRVVAHIDSVGHALRHCLLSAAACAFVLILYNAVNVRRFRREGFANYYGSRNG